MSTPAGLRIAVRLVREKTASTQKDTLATSSQAWKLVGHLRDMDREHLVCIHLDARNAVIGIETVSIGALTAAIVHPREVFKAAILNNAAGIILAHNHPSGSRQPSSEDVETTERIKNAGHLLGIHLLDHIIVAGDEYYSFQDEEKLNARNKWEDS